MVRRHVLMSVIVSGDTVESDAKAMESSDESDSCPHMHNSKTAETHQVSPNTNKQDIVDVKEDNSKM